MLINSIPRKCLNYVTHFNIFLLNKINIIRNIKKKANNKIKKLIFLYFFDKIY